MKLFFLIIAVLIASKVNAQYLGVTCGYQYSAQLTGPVTYPNQFNISLYNPDPQNPNATWDDWVEQMAQAGVDYVCPNMTGSYPNTSANPTNIMPLIEAIDRRGLSKRIKLALFDDNAASWVAQWNLANGRGFGYAEKFDMSDTNNWKYIYDYNYKLFYQTVPDTNRFKIDGRPVIIIWTGNTVTFLTNMQGNASRALTYVRQCCERDFGFNPYIILSSDFFSNDTTCNNPGIADGAESWFIAGPDTNYKNSWSLTSRNGYRKIGVAVPEFQHTGQGGFLDPNHGVRFEISLSNTVNANALLTLCEGFTDYEEDAAMWRVRNLDAAGSILNYASTLYDYPNQRINILRKHSNWPFPPELKFEAEGCDYYGGAAGGNGKSNFYRNGNIAIEPTSDVGGGFDVGWIQSGEWLEWENVPIQGSHIHFQVRVAAPNGNGMVHFVIDGTNYPVMTVPDTGGDQTWATLDSGATYSFGKGSTHTVRLVCDNGGFNINYWQYHDDLPIGENIRLLSQANSQWVSAASGMLNANVSNPGTDETFAVVDASDGYGYGFIALQAMANGQYLTADTNGVLPLMANAAEVGPSQIFQWSDNGDDTITLRALANSKLISVTNYPSTSPIIPSRARDPRPSETFSVTSVSSNTLSFMAQPNDTVEGAAITAGALGEVQVLALDGNGTPISGATITISMAVGTGTITDGSALTGADGIAHFTNLTIDKVGSKTLRAAGSAFKSAFSDTFNITVGPAAALTVESAGDGSGEVVAAENVPTGASVKVFAILRDSGGNFVENTSATWSLVNLSGGVVSGDLVASGDARSAMFTGHALGSAVIRAVAAFAGQSGIQTVTTVAPIFANGTFSNNSVLTLAGTKFQELYGVSLGDNSTRTSVNGYTFDSYPSANLTYGGSSAYALGVFLGDGGTSGDSGLDAVLNSAELGINGGTVTLKNLTSGTRYKVLFLAADTRSGMGTRTFQIAMNSALSSSQSYAFSGGSPSLGGYVLCTFVASGTTQTFTNTQSAYGYQLNSVLVGTAPSNNPAVVTGIVYNESSVILSGMGGPAGGLYKVLTATNVADALSNWTPVTTNYFDAKGSFTNFIPVDETATAHFYRLIQP